MSWHQPASREKERQIDDLASAYGTCIVEWAMHPRTDATQGGISMHLGTDGLLHVFMIA
jgi:hypothetical protein